MYQLQLPTPSAGSKWRAHLQRMRTQEGQNAKFTNGALAALLETLLTDPQFGSLESSAQFTAFMDDLVSVVTLHCGGQVDHRAEYAGKESIKHFGAAYTIEVDATTLAIWDASEAPIPGAVVFPNFMPDCRSYAGKVVVRIDGGNCLVTTWDKDGRAETVSGEIGAVLPPIAAEFALTDEYLALIFDALPEDFKEYLNDDIACLDPANVKAFRFVDGDQGAIVLGGECCYLTILRFADTSSSSEGDVASITPCVFDFETSEETAFPDPEMHRQELATPTQKAATLTAPGNKRYTAIPLDASNDQWAVEEVATGNCWSHDGWQARTSGLASVLNLSEAVAIAQILNKVSA